MVIGYINVTQEVNNNKCIDQLFNMLIGVQTPFEKSEVTFAIRRLKRYSKYLHK